MVRDIIAWSEEVGQKPLIWTQLSVSSQEAKSLAEEAGNATTKIENRIEEIQATTGETVDDIEMMTDRVQSGADTIEDAVTMFDEIADAIQQAESGIREISEATEDQAASTEEVVAMVDEVSGVSQQTAAEATNVSAASEEQASSLSEASSNIQQLSSLAEELHDNVEDFEVGDGTTDPASTNAGVSSGASAPSRPAEQTDSLSEPSVESIEPGTDLSLAGTDGGRDVDPAAEDPPEADR